MPGGRINLRLAAVSGPRGLPAFSALLGLLALLMAGCDYWDNLTEPKAVDKGGLSVVIVDAWTGNTLAGATCGDSGKKWTQKADGAGRFARADMETGPLSLVCSSEHYLNRRLEVSVKAGKVASATVAMARKGGEDWYREDATREVALEVAENNGRFPGPMRLQAHPADTAGIFRYEWTSTHHGNLSGKTGSSISLNTDPQPVDKDTLEITLGLRVMATLADTTYEVGRTSGRVYLQRNQLPAIAFFGNIEDSIKVGCREETDVFRFGLIASDPDGECRSVSITNSDTTSSLGKVQSIRACSQGEVLEFPLKGHASGLGVSLTLKNRLKIRVTDDNGQYQDTVVDFETYSTLPQKISLEQEEVPEKNFPDTSLKFRIKSGSGNSGFSKLFLDWKDGQKDTLYLASSRIESFDRSFVHSFRNPGLYEVEARIIDKCDDTSKVTLIVPVVANQAPAYTGAALPSDLWPNKP